MIARLLGRLDARVASGDPRRIFAVVAGLLVVAAVALTASAPDRQLAPEPADPSAPRSLPRSRIPFTPPPVPPEAVRVARQFVGDYLRYLHGRAGADAIDGASRELRRSIAARRLRVPDGARHRRPRIVRVRGHELAPGRWFVSATIADGGDATYPIEQVVADRAGRVVVTRLVEDWGGRFRVPASAAAAAALVAARAARSRRVRFLVGLPIGAVVLIVVLTLGLTLALGGAGLGCIGGGGTVKAGPAPSRSAVAEIPPARLRLYQRAGRVFDIDWAFLAAVAAQECSHGPETCPGDNGSGCAGPMQISMRRGSPCSPAPDLPTLWEVYGTDGDGDGDRDVNSPPDAIYGAAKILRRAKGAPPTGGSYARYRRASCNYYGACSVYADEVMARAVQYGFAGAGSPSPSDPERARPAPGRHGPGAGSGGGCGGGSPHVAEGPIGPVERQHKPRRFAPIPASIVAPGFGPVSCDARIIPNVVYLARRFRMLVTACAEIHSLAGEHPLGAAIDAVPANGDWTNTTERAARALGWKPICAASGVSPACARPPFRGIFYNGFPSHGDPAHCPPASGCPPHLHLSWHTSASQGERENAARTTLYSPSWIDVFTVGKREANRVR